jgi:T5SS/PEP-CTERM-associated repeat protein
MKTRFVPLLLALGIGNGSGAEPFTNVIDGFATNIIAEFVVGNTAPYNFLLITNAGAMTNLDRVFIGNAVESHHNSAVVSEIGSVWHLNDTAYLGVHSASNILSVLGGATTRAERVLAVGLNAPASNNLLRVAGIDTRLTGGTLHFGTYGVGNQFVVEDSGNAEFGTLIFNTEGRTNGGRQTAIVRGVGTQLSITNLLQIGNSPSNTLRLSEGARLVTRNSFIGRNASDGNEVVVSGAGTRWLNVADMVIGRGFNSNQTVTIRDLGEVQTLGLVVGEASSSEHTVLVIFGGKLTTSQLRLGEGMNAARNRLEVHGAWQRTVDQRGVHRRQFRKR